MIERKIKYLQIALNADLASARQVMMSVPIDNRIIFEAGTPLIKLEGIKVITHLKQIALARGFSDPTIIADLKTFDRAETEVSMAAQAGASGIIALGHAPIPTLDAFVTACRHYGITSMIDTMNTDFPLRILREMKDKPDVIVLHRGVDETEMSDKMLPLHEIRRIKGELNTIIAVAGGDTPREIQSAIFNDADIVVVWKDFYQKTNNTQVLAQEFLKNIR